MQTNDYPNHSAVRGSTHDHFQDVFEKYPESIHLQLMPEHHKQHQVMKKMLQEKKNQKKIDDQKQQSKTMLK